MSMTLTEQLGRKVIAAMNPTDTALLAYSPLPLTSDEQSAWKFAYSEAWGAAIRETRMLSGNDLVEIVKGADWDLDTILPPPEYQVLNDGPSQLELLATKVIFRAALTVAQAAAR